MKRSVLSFVVISAMLLVSISGCAPTSTPVPPTATAVPPTAIPAAFPLSITDSLGRKVTVDQVPQRVVSLAPSLTEMLFAVGAGDQVVGVTSYCNYPPEAATREQVGGFSGDSISVERIVALKPGLVLANGAIHQPIIEALETVNVAVVSIDPANLSEVYEDLDLVGRLTGHREEAAQVVEKMRARIADVVARVETIPQAQRLTVFWEMWDEPLMTAGPGTFPGQLIDLAGGINIFAELSDDWPTVSAEQVLARNPDVIMGSDNHGDKLSAEIVAQRPGWSQVAAVRDGRVYLLDGDIVSRPGPRLAEAALALAQALYPDLFK